MIWERKWANRVMDCEATEAQREEQNDASPTWVELSPHWLGTCEQKHFKNYLDLALAVGA
jgi:hypothetical protein